MGNHFNPSVSIEKFAAYLDGNLPEDEMLQISSLIKNDETLKSIFDVSKQVDMSLEEYSFNGLQIPEEIVSLDFDLPNINNTSVPLDMSSIGDVLTPDIFACSDESLFVEDNSSDCPNINDSDISHKDYFNDDNIYNSPDIDNTQITFDE